MAGLGEAKGLGRGHGGRGLVAGALRSCGGLGPEGAGTWENVRLLLRSLVLSLGRTNVPLCSIGHHPLQVRCPKTEDGGGRREKRKMEAEKG